MDASTVRATARSASPRRTARGNVTARDRQQSACTTITIEPLPRDEDDDTPNEDGRRRGAGDDEEDCPTGMEWRNGECRPIRNDDDSDDSDDSDGGGNGGGGNGGDDENESGPGDCGEDEYYDPAFGECLPGDGDDTGNTDPDEDDGNGGRNGGGNGGDDRNRDDDRNEGGESPSGPGWQPCFLDDERECTEEETTTYGIGGIVLMLFLVVLNS